MSVERAGFRGVGPTELADTEPLRLAWQAAHHDAQLAAAAETRRRLRRYPATAQVVPETCPACEGHGAWQACDCLTGPCPHEPLLCERCGGAGWVPMQCERCGEHDATQRHGDDALCTACWLDAEERECQACDGTGRVEAQTCGHTGSACPCALGVVTCERCSGTGRAA